MKKHAFPLTLAAVCLVGVYASWFSIQQLAEQQRVAAIEQQHWKLRKAIEGYKAKFGAETSAVEYRPSAATSTDFTEPTLWRYRASPAHPRK